METNKDFDSIMRTITGKLTGDPQTDMAYLQSQMEHYKDHELGQEILRACGRLMYDLIPDEKKEALGKAFNNDTTGIKAALEEAHFNVYKKDYQKALSIMEALVGKVEALNMFQDDKVSEYHVFDELFEEILYDFRAKPSKTLRRAELPYTEIYLMYGSLLFEMKRMPEAQIALQKGLHWNPVHFRIMSEYIESFKVTGDLEQFFNLTLEAFKIAFRSADLARCYRNLGFYFVEKKLWSEAMACCLLSLQFDKGSNQAQSELYYIHSATGGKIPQPSIEQAKEYGKKYGFPIGADQDVLGLSFSYGKHFMEQNKAEGARYFLSIAYDLTDDQRIKEMIESLE